MYSPADLPSSRRAAPAKKRMLSTATGISSFAYASGLPTFCDSSSASSSPCCVERVRELEQHLGALARRRLEPFRQGLLRRLHGPVDVLGARAGHLGDRLAGGRVEHLHGLAARRVDPLAADEVLVLGNGGAHVYLLRRIPVSRVRRCAIVTGSTVITITKKTTTFTWGSCCPSRRFAEDPDRQGVLRACGEGRHDHLVERERECEQRTGDERSRDDGKGDEAEGLPAVGPEVHRRFRQRRLRPPQPGDDVVVDDHDAEGRMADHDRPERRTKAVDGVVREERVQARSR